MRKEHGKEVGTPHPIPPSPAAISRSSMEGSSTCWFISFARHQPVAEEQFEAHSKENSSRACSNHGRQLALAIQEHASAEIQPWSQAESPSTVAAHKAAARRCNSNGKKAGFRAEVMLEFWRNPVTGLCVSRLPGPFLAHPVSAHFAGQGRQHTLFHHSCPAVLEKGQKMGKSTTAPQVLGGVHRHTRR